MSKIRLYNLLEIKQDFRLLKLLKIEGKVSFEFELNLSDSHTNMASRAADVKKSSFAMKTIEYI